MALRTDKLRERFERANHESLEIVESAPSFFVVRGSVGTFYNVAIDEGVHCSCPDAQSGKTRGTPLCKHRMLVLTKVMGMGWEEIRSLAQELVSEGRWGGMPGGAKPPPPFKGVEPRDTETCVICLEDLQGRTRSSVSTLTHCKAKCGTKFHRKCIEGWVARRPKCPMCRSSWIG